MSTIVRDPTDIAARAGRMMRTAIANGNGVAQGLIREARERIEAVEAEPKLEEFWREYELGLAAEALEDAAEALCNHAA